MARGPQAPGTCFPAVSVVSHRGKSCVLLILWLPGVEMLKSGPCTTQDDCISNAASEDGEDWCLYHWTKAEPADIMRVW